LRKRGRKERKNDKKKKRKRERETEKKEGKIIALVSSEGSREWWRLDNRLTSLGSSERRRF
jgi:hypothetical protein